MDHGEATGASRTECEPKLAATTQFVIERSCPIEGGEPPDGFELPFDVFVHLPASEPPTYEHEKCDGVHYRVTRPSALKMGFSYSVPWVCEHMGRLIE